MNKPRLFFRSGSAALLRSLTAFVSCALALASLQAAERIDATQANGLEASAGVVYTASNSSSGNEVFAYERSSDGQLAFREAFATGGTGNDVGLGSQSGLVMSNDNGWLLVVNPGSNDISVFHVGRHGKLTLTDTEPSNGVLPISVTIHGHLVYVLNSGGDGNISGYTLSATGDLAPIAGSVQPLSGMTAPGPAQIQFAPGGSTLVVTEKVTSLIDLYAVDGNGVAAPPVSYASAGQTPFGFDFSKNGYLIVSEAFGGAPDVSAVSNYIINGSGELEVVDPSEPTHETAACWIATTDSGRFAYTTNTGSGTITGFRINKSTGQLIVLDADGITAETGLDSAPIDEALSNRSRYLYVLNSGTHEIVGFRVRQFDGGLDPISSVGGLPDFAFGLIAR